MWLGTHLICQLFQCNAGWRSRASAFHSSVSAQLGLDAPEVQHSLRQVQRALHPDRVAQHPDAHAANTTAFAVLQAYLSALRGGGGSAASEAARMYHLDFYAWLPDIDLSGKPTPDWQTGSAASFAHASTAAAARDPRNWAPGAAPNIQGRATQDTQTQTRPHAAEQGTKRDQKQSHQADDNASTTFTVGDTTDEDMKLRRVTLRLPPPPPDCAAHLPRSVRRSLQALVTSLHLDDIFDEPAAASPVRSVS